MAIVDLLVIALLAVIVALVLQRRRSAAAPDQPILDSEARRLADEVTELRARIHILERAITDDHGSTDLTQEIERLRDR
ncbi:MAG: hypothetical protein M3R64_05845 [Pseudomonadota bacterium]|nr:hypothetical protein [Pseudomonadota bacterium]